MIDFDMRDRAPHDFSTVLSVFSELGEMEI